jgi:signal transduction histidine kinase
MSKYRLLQLGISDDMDYEYRRVTMLSNVVYLLIFGIVALFLAINLKQYPYPPSSPPQEFWIPFGLLVVCAAGLLLNHFHLQRVSKLLFLVTWIFFTTILVPVQRGATEAAFISVGLYATVSSVMVHILFSWRREKLIYIGMALVTWCIVLFFVEFLEVFRLPGDENVLFRSGFGRWRLLVIFLAVFFNGAAIYMVRVNYQLNESLLRRNEVIEAQNRQLAEQQASLVALTRQLRDKVDSTHEQLSEQSLKLTEYTYFNSHILRAPVSRIRGLINLLALKLRPGEEAEVRALLSESMKELDEAIKAITVKLTEGEESRNPEA